MALLINQSVSLFINQHILLHHLLEKVDGLWFPLGTSVAGHQLLQAAVDGCVGQCGQMFRHLTEAASDFTNI